MKTRIWSALIALCMSITAQAAPTPDFRTWEDMKYGLFVHYVWGGELSSMTSLGTKGKYPSNIDDLADRFNVSKWASEVKSMGFEYVIFTAWHANMNVLYPSPVMNSYRGAGHSTSKRDLLGEIADSLGKRGIKTALYTCISNGHDFHAKGVKAFAEGDTEDTYVTADQRATGYWPAARKGATSQEKVKWNNFLNEMYDEMLGRYKEKVFLLWGDCAWTGAIDFPRLQTTMRKHNPNILLLRNAREGGGFDVGCEEVSAPRDHYGFLKENPDVKAEDMTTWPAYTRSVAFIQGGYWWAWPWGKARYSGETIYRYTILNSAVSTGGGVSWSIGTFADGGWEPGILDSMNRAGSLLAKISESWKGTIPSTSFPSKQGIRIETLANGFVATKTRDDSTEYIHVLKRPSGNAVNLPFSADGKLFESATHLVSKKTASLVASSGGYTLTLPSGETWDALNTVFKLKVASSANNISLDKTALASSECFGNVASNTVSTKAPVDAIWSGCLENESGYTGPTVPQWLRIDLGDAARHHSLVSWKLTSANDGEGAVSDFKLQTSEDGATWKTIDSIAGNKSKILQRPLGRVLPTRYVRILITKASSNWDPRVKISRFDLFGIATVRFYANTNFSGNAIGLSAGDYTTAQLKDLGLGDNAASSAAVPKGLTAQIFDQDGFASPLQSISEDQADFVALAMNDKMSSVRIVKTQDIPTLANESIYRHLSTATPNIVWRQGMLYVSGAKNEDVQIFDNRGRLAIKVKLEEGVGNASELKPGVYFLSAPVSLAGTRRPFTVLR